MRTIKLILIILLVAVTALFGFTKVSEKLSGENEGPQFQCQEQLIEISVEDEESALLSGLTASDNQDGDLTDRIRIAGVSQLITEDTATVTYLVFDSDDNMAQLQRTVRYTDYHRPRISVTEPLVFNSDNTATLIEHLSAWDVIDGDISDQIRISNLWATEYAQVYSVTALVTNSMGDSSQVKLPVIVQDMLMERPEITLGRQLVYVEQGESFDPMDYLKSVTVDGKSVSVSEVEVTHQVDTDTIGNYWVHYAYSQDGVQGIAILTVVVE